MLRRLGLAMVLLLPMLVAAREYHPGDMGDTGLMQVPTARLQGEGAFSFGLSLGFPYDNLYFKAQPLHRLEAVFRYTEVDNRRYGADWFSGDQSLKDRGFDFKWLLREESEHWPALALGVRDFAGTSLFGAEYLVASRRVFDFDLTLGLGWGRLGTRGGERNPLTWLSSHFEEREQRPDLGGKPRWRSWFTGREVALFGGLEWHLPRGFAAQLEVEGNDYQSEPHDNHQRVRSRVNAALARRMGPLHLRLAYERGDVWVLGLGINTNFERFRGPAKIHDPPAPLATPSTPPASLSPEVEQRLRRDFRQQGLRLGALEHAPQAGRLSAWMENDRYRNEAQAYGRAARLLSRVAPAGTRELEITELREGMETRQLQLPLAAVRRADFNLVSAEELWLRSRLQAPEEVHPQAEAGLDRPRLDHSLQPALRQHIGGPESPYLYQLWLRARADLQLARGWDVSSAVGLDLTNNFDRLRHGSDSVLPHVRSDVARYLREGETNLVRLETNYVRALAPEWYGRVSAGIFEEMYAGVAGEVLYKPFDAPWAVGLNISRVRQRDYDQRFDFLDYEVTTGHLTGYLNLPRTGLQLRLSGGRYLAADRGMTLDVGRRFSSGVVVGAFATRTNVSAAEFGEGSFDKGIYLVLPLDLFFTRSSRRHAHFVFRPLTRDGGQKVRDGKSLYGLVGDADRFQLSEDWDAFFR